MRHIRHAYEEDVISGIDPPSSLEVDLPEKEDKILFGADGSVLCVVQTPFGFARRSR